MFESSKPLKLKEGIQFDQADFEAADKVLQDSIKKALENPSAGFDLRTHIVEPRSGVLIKYQPYRRVCNGSHVYYIRRDEKGIERRYTEQGNMIDGDADRADRGAAPIPKSQSKAAHEHKTVSV